MSALIWFLLGLALSMAVAGIVLLVLWIEWVAIDRDRASLTTERRIAMSTYIGPGGDR